MNILNCETAYNVYTTDNYDLFKFIESNRTVKKAHVNKLAQQITEGYEMPPIIVKPNGEILDGQHRFEALRELGDPIEFIIRNEIKQDTLQKSNTLVSKWTPKDHINFHMKEGNENYKELKDFIEYSELGVVTATRLLGKVDCKATTQGVVDGQFVVTNKEDAYAFVDEVLIKIRASKPTEKIVQAVRKVYNVGIDNKRLVNCVNALYEELELISRIPAMAERIATLYNKDLPKSERIKNSKQTNGDVKLS